MAPVASAVVPAGTIAIHRPDVAIESRRVDPQTVQTVSV